LIWLIFLVILNIEFMKTAIYFILACFISTGAFLAALNMKNPWPAFIVAFGSWALFFWGWNRRVKKQAERRSGERLFADYMRSKLRQPNR
jgi:membrane protein implicated in regulation of membrane protease activity